MASTTVNITDLRVPVLF